MNSLKPQLSRKNPTQLIALSDVVVPKLAPPAPGVPPVPNMAAKVASLVSKTAEAKTANDAYEAWLADGPGLKAARDAKADELRLEHAAVVSAIESEAKGDEVMLAASGYPLANAPANSTAPPGKVLNLKLTAGDGDGEIDGMFAPQDPVSVYEVQCTMVDPIAGPWATVLQPTASKFSLAGMTSGQRCWIRVRAINSNGPGAWSDPATKIVP